MSLRLWKMDALIQMLPLSLRKFSTYIDFVGQKKAERIFQVRCRILFHLIEEFL